VLARSDTPFKWIDCSKNKHTGKTSDGYRHASKADQFTVDENGSYKADRRGTLNYLIADRGTSQLGHKETAEVPGFRASVA